MHNNSQADALLSHAAHELESLRASTGPFPVACCRLLWSIPGNDRCVDCGSRNPEWANVSFGTLVCIQCSGRHRSFGVHISKVRSVHMDAWNHSQVLCMLEGGNEQLLNFLIVIKWEMDRLRKSNPRDITRKQHRSIEHSLRCTPNKSVVLESTQVEQFLDNEVAGIRSTLPKAPRLRSQLWFYSLRSRREWNHVYKGGAILCRLINAT